MMSKEAENPIPTREQTAADLLRLGELLTQHNSRPICDLASPRPNRPEESSTLMAEIAELERRIEIRAYSGKDRTLRSVLGLRKDEVLDSSLLRCLASIAFQTLDNGRPRPTVSSVSRAAGMGDWGATLSARHAIRNAIIRGNAFYFSDNEFGDGILKCGPDLVRFLSGDNDLPLIWTEATLKEEKEEFLRRHGDVLKRVSPPDEATKPAPINPPVPQVSLKACESPKAIFNALSRTVIGLEKSDTFRSFCVAMSLHLRRANQIRQGIVPATPSPVLCVVGESGVGKTFLIEEFCKMASIPHVIGSLAECTSSGYAGIDLTDILMGLFRNGAKRSEIEAGGIVFFDEADKRRINDRRGDFDCTGAGLQAELLRMVEGTDIQLGGRKSNDNVKGMLSTRGLCFVLAGCFDGVAQIMESKSRPKCHLGFGGHIENIGPAPDIRSALTTFFLPELCNRISTILYIKPPSLEQLIQIANAPRGILDKQNQFLRSSLGLTLKPSEEAIKAICGYALDSKTYARGIRSLLQALQEDAIFEEKKGELAIGAEEVGKVIGGLRQGGAGQE